MIGSKTFPLAVTLAGLLTFPAIGFTAQPELGYGPSSKAKTQETARFDSQKASDVTTVAKNGKKKPEVKKKSAPKSKSKVYRYVGNKAKSSVKKKYQPVKLDLPRPDRPKTPEFVIEVSSPTDTRLERAFFSKLTSTEVELPRLPNFSTSYRGRVAGITDNKDFIQYSIDPELQEYARSVISRVSAGHIGMVAMEPGTGRILAMAGKSPTLNSAVTHAGYPAASLIKLVTTAAAIEYAAMDPMTEVAFRGGTYELSPLNYDPRPGADRRIMSVSEALGRSCNPVFSRVALRFLNPALFRYETAAFGFNSDLKLQVPLSQSLAVVPNNDYDFGRTAAGFGEIYISPVHAAAMMSALANQGKLPRPSVIDQIMSPTGEVLYRSAPAVIRQSVRAQTAETLLHMMTATTRIGTSKREFDGKVPWEVPAKTGTLKGDNPKGLNNWFIAAAPLDNPKIAVAVVVVNPSGTSSKASHLGRLLLEKYLR